MSSVVSSKSVSSTVSVKVCVSSSSLLRGLSSPSPGVEAREPLLKRERKERRFGFSLVDGRDSEVDGREPRDPNQDRRFFFSGCGSSSLDSATPTSVAFVEIESSSRNAGVSCSVACFRPAWAFAAARSSSVACFNLCGNQPVSTDNILHYVIARRWRGRASSVER